MTKRTTGEGPNPSGLCMCGCGERTNIAPMSCAARGDVFGTPLRFVLGHGSRKSPVEYIVDPATGCWVWQRAMNPNGYGQVARSTHGGTGYAHRLIYERIRGPIPAGLQLDHLCRNRACVNPAHLEAVTGGENRRRGDGVKLTLEQAQSVHAMLADGDSMATIGRRFGVSPACIREIKCGRNWQDSAAGIHAPHSLGVTV
jgi:hypothetical protein